MTTWRLVVTEPLDGARNMAVDEAIFTGRLDGLTPPTLRFFSWSPATLSLGYGQTLNERIQLDACRALGIGLVRRPTGGSAIYHDTIERELTYSVVARSGDFPGADDLLETYRRIAAGLLRGLQRLGVAAEIVPTGKPGPREMASTFCFARTGRYEIEVGGKKLVGSAQRRRRGAFLQHGSILLGADAERLRLLFPEADPLSTMTTIEAALGRRVSADELISALTAGMQEALGIRFERGGLTAREQEMSERLVGDKYGTPDWNLRGVAAAGIGTRPGIAKRAGTARP